MIEVYVELLEALRRRLALVADGEFRERDAQGHLAALREATRRVDELRANLPREADARLVHFLEVQSYLKAVAWLEAELGQG